MNRSPLPDDYIAAAEKLGDVILRADCTETDAQQHVIMAVAALDLATALYTANNALKMVQPGLTGEVAKIVGQQIAINNFALAKAGMVREVVS